MVKQEFVLNNVFKENAKIYQTMPVRAARYKSGMETGWMVYFYNKATKTKERIHEGMKFFDTEKEAWDYINANHKQYAEEKGVLTEVPVIYDPPVPVLHRKETDIEKKVGFVNCFEGRYAFLSNETEQYDFFILDYYYKTNDTWIIQAEDGSIRVWDKDFFECCGETFFGNLDNLVYQKVEKDKYIKVAV